ncbi:MAG TPA: hypothetical protein VGM86_35670 [Thermoanaerobaculia bacterium]|jgi:WD40 repeat protein
MSVAAARALPPPDSGTVDAENPWPGLAAFREEDEDFFHGRDAEIEELLRLILRGRLTVLFGLSGLGKTSLLQAGLFPRLRVANILPVYIRLDYAASSQPFTSQIKDAIVREAAASGIEAPVPQAAETLWEYFHRQGADFWSPRNRPVTPLLVFDQFEELFTLGKGRQDAVGTFVDELADLVEGRPPEAVKARLDAAPDQARGFAASRHPYKVLLSLREDFLPDLEGLRDHMRDIAQSRLRLHRMNGEEAKRVVTLSGGHLIAPEVAERVIRFVAGEELKPGERPAPLAGLEVEPALLSVFCRELNNKRLAQDQPRITADLLDGSRTEILANFYERSMADVRPEVRTFVEESLLTLSGYRDSVALDKALNVPGVTQQAIDRLTERRLVRTEERGGVERLELTHDVLTGVVQESRDRRRQREEQAKAEAARLEAEAEAEAARLEAQAKAEAARLEAEARERQVRHALRRSRMVAGLLFALLLLAAAGAWWGFVGQRAARAGQGAARAANRQTAQALREVSEALKKLGVKTQSESAAKRRAEDALVKAEEANQRTQEALAEAERAGVKAQQANLQTKAALSSSAQQTSKLLGKQKPFALAYLASAVRSDPQSIPARSLLLDLLLNKRWHLPVIVIPHDFPVDGAELSPDGKYVLTASNQGALGMLFKLGEPSEAPAPEHTPVSLWDAQTGQRLGQRFPIPEEAAVVSSLSFSPDGRFIVGIEPFENMALIWDVRTGQLVGEPLKHEGSVVAAEPSPDSRLVLTASGATAQLWDARTGQPVGEPMKHDDSITSAEFNRRGDLVLTASADKTARLWNGRTGQPMGEPLRYDSEVAIAKLSPDGQRVLTVCKDKTAHLWDLRTRQTLGEPMRHESPVVAAEFSGDERLILTATQDGTINLWDARTGKASGEPMRQPGPLTFARFSPDSLHIVTTAEDRAVRLWDVPSHQILGEPLWHEDRVTSARFSANGKYLLTASSDKTARLWEVRAGSAVVQSLETEQEALFNPDCQHMVLVRGGVARLWDIRTGKLVGKPMGTKVSSTALSADGKYLLTVAGDTVQVWDKRTGDPLGKPMRQERTVTGARFTPDGRRLVTSSAKDLSVWEIKTGHRSGPVAMDVEKLSPDGQRALAVEGSTVELRDALSGQLVSKLADAPEDRSALTIDFSPDGQWVIMTFPEVRAWNAQTGQPISRPIPQKERFVVDADVSSDGKRMAAVMVQDLSAGSLSSMFKDDDEEEKIENAFHASVRILSNLTGKPVGVAISPKSFVTHARFSPDGQRLVTASENGSLELWDAFTGQSLGEPVSVGAEPKSIEFSPDGQRVLVQMGSDARIWDVPNGSPGEADILAKLAETVGGYKVDESGAVVPLLNQVAQLAKLRKETAQAKEGGLTASSFLRWFLADPWERPISPLSQVKVPDYIRQLLTAGTEESRQEAKRTFPGHPLLAKPPR